MSKNIIGIDPGLKGAFVILYENGGTAFMQMPLTAEKEINFDSVLSILDEHKHNAHVFLERGMPLAMGSKHAFTYGRGYAALEIAIKFLKIPVTYIHPKIWCKAMFDGIDADLKPKAKSIIAVKRLLPQLVELIPTSKKGKLDEGIVDALLIAEYGRRQNV